MGKYFYFKMSTNFDTFLVLTRNLPLSRDWLYQIYNIFKNVKYILLSGAYHNTTVYFFMSFIV